MEKIMKKLNNIGENSQYAIAITILIANNEELKLLVLANSVNIIVCQMATEAVLTAMSK